MTSGQNLYDDGVLRITRTGRPPVLVLAGEIDEATYPGLVAALDTVADVDDEIHFNLAAVDYCDLAGLRAIVALAGRRGHGRRVVLHEVPPHLKTILRVVGWDLTPGLIVDPDRGHRGHSPAHQR